MLLCTTISDFEHLLFKFQFDTWISIGRYILKEWDVLHGTVEDGFIFYLVVDWVP